MPIDIYINGVFYTRLTYTDENLCNFLTSHAFKTGIELEIAEETQTAIYFVTVKGDK